MLLTLDSSVIVAALRNQEPFHEQCWRILEQLRDGRHVAVQPFTVLVEVAAAIRRRTGSEDLALRVYHDLRSLASLRFVELDAVRTEGAIEVARLSGVRGMDAIVLQIAREFHSALVSLDEEMLAQARGLARVEGIEVF